MPFLTRSIALLTSTASLAIALPAIAQETNPPQDPCAEIVQTDSTLTRPELRQFLRVQRGAARAEVTAALGEPYCRLAAIEVELPDGNLATVQRDAYPFDFAPQTWVVVFYTGDRYLTFDYSFRPAEGAPTPEAESN